jgi:hypothetical protein
MRCLYCGTPLAIMRMFANGSFCSDEHRSLYESEQNAPPVAAPLPAPESTDTSQSGREAVDRCCGAVAIDRPTPRRGTFERTVAVPRPSGLTKPVLGVRVPLRKAQRFDGKLPLAGRANPATVLPRRAGTCRVVIQSACEIPAALDHPLTPACPAPAMVQANPWPPMAGRVPLRFELAARAQNNRMGRAMGTPAGFTGNPLIPRLEFDLAKCSPSPLPDQAGASSDPLQSGRDPMAIDLSTQRLREIWRRAPSDLKLIAMVIPMILLLTLNAAGPRLYTKPVATKLASQPMFDGLLARQWNAVRKTIARRAGFDYSDDFRSGLDNWSFGGGPVSWSYDNMGFVRPAGLALFRPTLPLGNYHVQFIARVDERGLGFAFRATNANNYQAVRLVMTRPGPVPEWHVVRYAVVGGHETSRSDKLLPVALTPEKFFTVRLEVAGNDFTLMVLDKVADFWSDDRLKTGGIGFFCGKGEQARVRHVDVSYQNDTLGRFCAFIASDNGDNNDGS